MVHWSVSLNYSLNLLALRGAKIILNWQSNYRLFIVCVVCLLHQIRIAVLQVVWWVKGVNKKMENSIFHRFINLLSIWIFTMNTNNNNNIFCSIISRVPSQARQQHSIIDIAFLFFPFTMSLLLPVYFYYKYI